MADPFVPEESLNFFRRKGLKPGFDYRDVWKEEHATSFTVAKMTQLDLLSDVRGMVEKAIEEGQTFQQFRNTLKPELVKKGWWGVQEMDDPQTGRKERVQLGSDQRIRTIYETNMRTARAAGQWERIQRTKEEMPYLLYGLGPSREHRIEHTRWAGTLLPVDDPWWATHTPPNGWGCKCHIRQVSEDEYEILVKDTRNITTEAPPHKTREWVNSRTGEIEQLPVGIEPGWNYNPGAAYEQKLKQITDKMDAAPFELARSTSRAMVDSDMFRGWHEAPKGNFPVAVLGINREKIGAQVQTVQLSPETQRKQVRVHPELTPADYLVVQQAIDEGEVVQDGKLNLIHILETVGYTAVIKATKTGKGLYLTSLRKLSRQEAKRDEEIQRLRDKAKK